jgi:hypothetical protein
MQHLERELGLIAVGRLVDDRHSPDAEELVEAILSSEHLADALLRKGFEIGFVGHRREGQPPTIRRLAAQWKVRLS